MEGQDAKASSPSFSRPNIVVTNTSRKCRYTMEQHTFSVFSFRHLQGETLGIQPKSFPRIHKTIECEFFK
jgi:hypothetical protein